MRNRFPFVSAFAIALISASGVSASAYVSYVNLVGSDTTVKVDNRSATGAGVGLAAISTFGSAVKATSTSGNAVYATATGSAPSSIPSLGNGVYASATGASSFPSQGNGVFATSTSGRGVYAKTSAGEAALRGDGGSFAAVIGQGTSVGVWGSGSIGTYGGGGYNGVRGVGTLGVYGITNDPYGAAVYGEAPWPTAMAAYFDGNVGMSGVCAPCTFSDAALKKNIRAFKGGLARVMALKPSSYELKTDEYASLSLPKGTQNGLIAQDLEKVVPEVVQEMTVAQPVSEDEIKKGVRKPALKLKGVNYAALVPILIAAIQEQQAQIEALKAGK